uniref:carbonic anhydrase n=1 Tax=Romanomermis culicivorax TaxID=13658 RepID=A0A915J707_ROMCU
MVIYTCLFRWNGTGRQQLELFSLKIHFRSDMITAILRKTTDGANFERYFFLVDYLILMIMIIGLLAALITTLLIQIDLTTAVDNVCESGTQQSPVDFTRENVQLDPSIKALNLRGYKTRHSNAQLQNTGHTGQARGQMHMVHVKSGLSMEKALNYSDGLAVLGVFLEESDVENVFLNPIIEMLHNVRSA